MESWFSFTLLTEYIVRLEEEKAAAITAASTIPNGAGEKRPAKEDVEEEKKKKPKVSQGIKALEKASKKGMKDMRTFFMKKPVEKVRS